MNTSIYVDTIQLQSIYRKLLRSIPIVLPIPISLRSTSPKTRSHKISVWWPGPPRTEKGTKYILDLAKRIDLDQFDLRASSEIDDPRISKLPSELSEQQYAEELENADIIILPYSPKMYGPRSSNIFVEAVLSKTKVLVSKETWMEKEISSCCELYRDNYFSDGTTSLVSTNDFTPLYEKYSEFHTLENYRKILTNDMEALL